MDMDKIVLLVLYNVFGSTKNIVKYQNEDTIKIYTLMVIIYNKCCFDNLCRKK